MEQGKRITSPNEITDTFGRKHNYLRLSLTDRCNLRCNYCMPANPIFLPASNLLTPAEIGNLIHVFDKLGINKIRLTGGEPLFRKDFAEIINRIAQYEIPLHLTTNAILLDEHIDLIDRHFKSLNISLDTLNRNRFRSITQRNSFDRTLENIELALSRGIQTKLNMVVVRKVNHDEILNFIKLTLKHRLEVRFIEFMPFKGNQWKYANSYSKNEILHDIRRQYPIEDLGRGKNQTASLYRIQNAPGTFGIISTVSHPFCDQCNRLRVTADGRLKNCLFSQSETDLKPYLANLQELEFIIRSALMEKKERYGGLEDMHQVNKKSSYHDFRPMTSIGG